MIKTATYYKECSCGAEGRATVEYSIDVVPKGNTWIRCSECQNPTWCSKKL